MIKVTSTLKKDTFLVKIVSPNFREDFARVRDLPNKKTWGKKTKQFQVIATKPDTGIPELDKAIRERDVQLQLWT